MDWGINRSGYGLKYPGSNTLLCQYPLWYCYSLILDQIVLLISGLTDCYHQIIY